MSPCTENRSPLGKEILKSINHIMKSHSPHFYALSILFVLPIFFTLVVYPSFHLALFHPHYNFTHLQSQMISFSPYEIIVFLMLTLLLVLFYLFAVATITYSAVQVSYGRPVNLVSSIKSTRNSFFPLLSTFIISHAIFTSVILVFTLVSYFVVQILQFLGLKYDLNHFWFLLILVPVLVWLQVNWSLAYVIAVVESKCGFETLRRSACLVKGIRWVALLNMMSYGLLMGMLVVCGSVVLVTLDAAEGNQWRSLGVIWQTALWSVLGFLMMNYYLLGNVATYMYCNDSKSLLEIGDKFAVSVPLDDEKKNHAIVQDIV